MGERPDWISELGRLHVSDCPLLIGGKGKADRMIKLGMEILTSDTGRAGR